MSPSPAVLVEGSVGAMLNLPNALTLLRILAVPLFLSLLVGHDYRLAFVLFVAAGITDGVDGFIARMYDQRTELGAHLDPLADKLLVVSSFIALGILGEMPLQLMIIVITRDVVILGGYLLTAAVVGTPMPMAPTIWGKLTTFTQLMSITFVLVGLTDWAHPSQWFLQTLFTATAVASFISGTGYVIQGIGYYSSSEQLDDPEKKNPDGSADRDS